MSIEICYVLGLFLLPFFFFSCVIIIRIKNKSLRRRFMSYILKYVV
jgi:hypothetical protein